MFTGIVEEIGTVGEITFPDGPEADAVMTVEGPLAASDAVLGDSIAVDGVCLTVVRVEGGSFSVDVMPESLRRTALAALAPGSRVNVERAMPAHGRLGGHIVQGHVDGVGRLVSRDPGARWDDLVLSAPAGVLRYVAEKGSITLDGVSLTVTFVADTTFGVSLIPTTLAATTLGDLAVGDQVNIEVDVIAKYVERLLAGRVAPHKDAS
ncbi:putative riboflavin synthase alpha chain [Paraoerskovia sediminicola]|uniref:Riboflavin synthase n=1 Tax=Paraoerskovia sediminicola TaxID=1138587 RepID=A0ABN6XFM3_9CELL|nr:riboflavin synthase [Paraoerskovia sediminicola]BDZ43654.1 putative riboflavin synthase alpha chain [Paraoerskovia sediminicola]